MRDLRDKVAFITGGASGIGLGMTEAFLNAGMKVIVADLLEDHLDEMPPLAEPDRLVKFQLDVSDRTAMAEAAVKARACFGAVHVLCNNAGVGTAIPLDEAGYEEWDYVLRVNLGGVVNGIVNFVPLIKAHGQGGHVVNTGSIAGMLPAPAPHGIYATSKYAIRGLTDSLRLALGFHNIGVTLLAPGLTRSRGHEGARYRAAIERDGKAVPENPGAAAGASAGIPAIEVGEQVVEAIRYNRPYVFSHGEFRDELAAHFEEVLAALPGEQEIDPGRAAFEAERRALIAAARRAANSVH